MFPANYTKEDNMPRLPFDGYDDWLTRVEEPLTDEDIERMMAEDDREYDQREDDKMRSENE
jgi:hypothetical protein